MHRTQWAPDSKEIRAQAACVEFVIEWSNGSFIAFQLPTSRNNKKLNEHPGHGIRENALHIAGYVKNNCAYYVGVNSLRLDGRNRTVLWVDY